MADFSTNFIGLSLLYARKCIIFVFPAGYRCNLYTQIILLKNLPLSVERTTEYLYGLLRRATEQYICSWMEAGLVK